MESLYSFKHIDIYKLNIQFIDKYTDDICRSLDQIPLVEKHTKDQLLTTNKGDRTFHSKFDHSLIALSNDPYVGIIIGYEREAERNQLYPKNSIYLSDLAVSHQFQKQGLGKFLVESWLKYNRTIGYITLSGELNFSVQTNSAEWNEHVQNLYTSFGFKKTAEKVYNNRTDNVYFLTRDF